MTAHNEQQQSKITFDQRLVMQSTKEVSPMKNVASQMFENQFQYMVGSFPEESKLMLLVDLNVTHFMLFF